MVWRLLVVSCVACVVLGCAQGDNSSTELTPAAFVAANSQVVEFSVPDMMCPEGCGVEIKEILAKQPGAKDVLIDFEHKTAIVAVEDDKFDADAAIAALADQMFPNSKLKGDSLAKPQAEGAAVQ
jgi:copper chaperone CopZ